MLNSKNKSLAKNFIYNVIYKLLNVLFFLPSCIGGCLTADGIIPLLYEDTFLSAIKMLRIASFLILGFGFSNLLYQCKYNLERRTC
jgi:O-antigen/teichoic acid export membrane protein